MPHAPLLDDPSAAQTRASGVPPRPDTPGRVLGSTPRLLILTLMAVAVFFVCLGKGSSDALIPGMPLKDPDDAMRLVQVIDLIEGASWYDLTQYRVDPPAGLDMHWSRLPDLPLVAFLLPAERFLDRDAAVILTARLVPPLLGVGFFVAFVWAAAPITGRNGTLYAGLVGLTLTIPLIQFAAGRVDHHGWQLLLAMVVAGALIRIVLASRPLRSAIIGGIAGGLGLWIGGEAFPWIGLAASALTLNWIRGGKPAADAMAVLGITLAAVSALLLPLTIARPLWGVPACDAFSIASVGIAGAVALLGIGAAAAERIPGFAGWRNRFAVSGLLATLGLATLYLVFPVCARGPFSQVSPEIAFWIDLVKESRSMGEMAATSPSLIGSFLVLPVVALIIAAGRFVLTTGRERTLWLSLLVLVAGGIGLQLWQIRGTFLANAYAGLPIAWLVARLGQWGDGMSMALTRVLMRVTPPLLLATLPTTAALLLGQAHGDDRTMEPSVEGSASRCDPVSVAASLDRIAAERPPLLIAAPIDLGPSLLLLTRHQVLGAPYHRNTGGLRDLRLLLYAEEESAEEVVRRRGVDVILVCPGDVLAARARAEGVVPFSDRLRDGELPGWVQPFPLEGGGELFTVDR